MNSDVAGKDCGCPGKSLPILGASFAQRRLEICNACDNCEGDTCKIVAEKKPDHASITLGVTREGLRCPLPSPKWTEEPQQCPACRRVSQVFGNKQAVCNYCKQRQAITGRHASTNKQIRFATNTNRRVAKGGNPFSATGEPQWLPIEQLALDSRLLAGILPSDITAIVGVARSGITPASIVASMLHLPLLAIRQTKEDVIEVGNGWRLGGNNHIDVAKSGKVAIIDDTVMTGNSFKHIAQIVANDFPNYVTAAIYVNPLAHVKPDVWVHDLGWPHLLEWNIFNSILSPNVAVDFDGILCHDPHGWQDDDGPKYIEFIQNAKPLYLSRKTPIPLIVTARIEKYRGITEAWLRDHGVRYNRLIMHPAATLRERNRDDLGAYKARHFEAWAMHHKPRPAPLMFIESDDNQARRIHNITGRMVVCPHTHAVYGR